MWEVPFERWILVVWVELRYSSSLCFGDIVEKVSFLGRVLVTIWMLLSSDVSKDGLAMRGVGVCSWGCVSDWLLKKDALGKKMISILDFLSLHPVCIWRPISSKVLFMMFAPWIVSSLVVKGKALSSKYNTCVISVVCVGG